MLFKSRASCKTFLRLVKWTQKTDSQRLLEIEQYKDSTHKIDLSHDWVLGSASTMMHIYSTRCYKGHAIDAMFFNFSFGIYV